MQKRKLTKISFRKNLISHKKVFIFALFHITRKPKVCGTRHIKGVYYALVLSDIVCPCETFCDYWSVQAAEQGYVEAYFRAAKSSCFYEVYNYKYCGDPNYCIGARGLEYIKKGAEAGNADCQLAFGDLILNNGRLVLTREVEKKCTEEEFEEAKEWWRKSAEQGNKEAKKRLQTLF